jgi:uncharacterized protein YukE
MSFLEVSPSTLQDVANKIASAMSASKDLMSNANSLVDSVAVGRGDVAMAIETFVRTWTYGLTCMNKDLTHLNKMLNSAASAYSGTESSIAKAAT